MLTQECKIPKWKKEQDTIQKQSFDDAFKSLGMRQKFSKTKKKKKVAKEVVREKVNS